MRLCVCVAPTNTSFAQTFRFREKRLFAFQISSEESIGSLAENVLEALQEHPDVAQKIKNVRRYNLLLVSVSLSCFITLKANLH